MIEWALLALGVFYVCRWGLRHMALAQSRALREDTVPLLGV